jgi:adiponectin receptor
MTAHLPHNFSKGMDLVYSAIRPPSPRLQDLPQQLQNVTLSLLHEEDEEHAVCPNTAAYRSFGAGASVLDSWLRDVITKSVMWPVPRWPFYVFMAGAMSCLLLSATCHLLCCCSRHMATSIWRFDYAGATILLVSTVNLDITMADICRSFFVTLCLLFSFLSDRYRKGSARMC